MPDSAPLSQTQITAIIAAFACLFALIAAIVHDRTMAQRSATGEPWLKPAQPLAILAIATLMTIMTAVFALQGR